MSQITCINDAVIFEGRKDAKFCSDECRKAYLKEHGKELKAPANIPEFKQEYDKVAALAAFQKVGLERVQWLSTGIPDFDALTMIPMGRVTQIQGPYAVGKTTLALNMIKGLSDKKVFYIDSEASLNPELLVELELDPELFHIWNKSAFIEDIYEVLVEAVKSGEYDLIVFDSLASCTTKVEAEGDITASNIGQKAKMVNKMMRIIPSELKTTNTALVIINQEREVIGGYVPQKYTPGGMGVPYAASLMISLKSIKSWRFGRTAADTKKGIFIGQDVEATIIKSKVNQPWRKKTFKLYYPQPIETEDEPDEAF